MLKWPEQRIHITWFLAQLQTLFSDSKYPVPSSLKSIIAIAPRRKRKDSKIFCWTLICGKGNIPLRSYVTQLI